MGPTEQQMGGIVAGGGVSGDSAGDMPTGENIPGASPMPGGDTGDIIISSGSEKPKMSRPLVLGVIIGVLVLVGGAVAAVVLLNQGKGGVSSSNDNVKYGVTTTERKSYILAYNRYVNYLLTGEDSVAEAQSNIPFSEEYMVVEVGLGGRNDGEIQYFTGAQELLDDFMNEISAAGENINGQEAFAYEWQDLELAKAYADSYLTDEYILKMFLDNDGDMDKTKDAIRGMLPDYNTELKDGFMNIYNTIVDEYGKYSNAGCIKNGEIVETCINKLAGSKVVKEQSNNLRSGVIVVMSNVISDCNNIATKMERIGL